METCSKTHYLSLWGPSSATSKGGGLAHHDRQLHRPPALEDVPARVRRRRCTSLSVFLAHLINDHGTPSPRRACTIGQRGRKGAPGAFVGGSPATAFCDSRRIQEEFTILDTPKLNGVVVAERGPEGVQGAAETAGVSYRYHIGFPRRHAKQTVTCGRRGMPADTRRLLRQDRTDSQQPRVYFVSGFQRCSP